MRRLIVTLVANAAGLYAASRLIDGFLFTGTLWELLLAALIFGLINWTVRPVVRLLFGPVILLTLGLFIFVINMAMLKLLDFATPDLVVLSLKALALSTVIIGFVNLIVSPIKSHHE
jgi:putative membrane protein